MTTPIRTNKPVFFGNNGEVLKSGYIYIGQPRQDPRNFPKTVTFKDSAGGLFTAAQPLRTNAQGQISYNGKAIIALVDGDYSLLVQDSNQVQTKDGWTPLVEADEADPNASTVVYRSLLSELKEVNVTPGQYVENVGKITAQDGEGAVWFVVSNTGSPGDDIDLIDFDNGTQGVRIENQVYAYPDYANFVKATAFYLADGQSGSSFDVSGNIPGNTTQSIGPTGSGADNIWTALDALPSNISYIECSIDVVILGVSTLNGIFSSGRTASSVTERSGVGGIDTSTTSATKYLRSISTAKLPVNSSGVFFARRLAGTDGVDISLDIKLLGFGLID